MNVFKPFPKATATAREAASAERFRPSKGIGLTNWMVSRASGLLERKTSRRGFLIGSAMAGSAVVVTGCQVATQPGSPYVHITDCGPSFCTDGWTEFCCAINGFNGCPPGSFAGGWWRADFSSFCNGTRYYIDCMEHCCGPALNSRFCAGCTECRCAVDCGTRRIYCNYFRYGQCHTEIAQSGPIACRVVTCVPPYASDPACINSPAVDNRTAEHAPNCLFNFEPGVPLPSPPPPPPRFAAAMPASCAAILPASGGQLLVAGRGWDGSLGTRTLLGDAWTPWFGIPAAITSGIGAVASRVADYAVVRGSDNAIWVNRRAAQQWSGFHSLGGQSRSDPAVVADAGAGAVQIFIRGIDDNLWANWYNGEFSAGWFQVGGQLTSDPVAVRDGSGVSVFARGLDDGIWQNRYAGGVWSGWSSLGGIVSSNPACVAVGSEIFVFVRSTDYAVWVNHFHGSAWSGWHSLGGAVISEPTVAADPSGVRIFALGWDSAIYTNQRTGSTWSGWNSLGGLGTADPIAVANSSGSYVVVRGGDGGLWYGQHTGNVWTGWQWLSGFVVPVRVGL